MIRIVDRRFDSKNKSSVNRGRFLRRFKSQIKKAVSDVVNRSGIKDMDDGKKISIPGLFLNPGLCPTLALMTN